MSESFMDLVVDGRVKPEEIDDWVDDWHTATIDGAQGTLYEYLGMTWEEYQVWASQPSALDGIIAQRQEHLPQKRPAKCVFCDRIVSVGLLAKHRTYVYPRHSQNNVVCAGSGAIVPNGELI